MSGSSLSIGLFGGTFDPVHLGHLVTAEEALHRLGLEFVLFVPAGNPWLKAHRRVAPAEHRLAMVRLAVADNPRFRVSDAEVRRPGPTYTVDTLRELRAELGPGVRIHLILGVDSLAELGRWHRPEEVLRMSAVVGMARPGAPPPDLEALDRIRPGASREVVLLEGPLIGVSGTEIRRRLAAGASVRYMLPTAVEEYIRCHRLYTFEGGEP